MTYYNERDAHAAAWLRELMGEGLIPEGVVDERDIKLVQPADLRGFTQCHFFAGIGGWPLALRLAGWPENLSVWTGSCPCHSFSSLGEQRGFNDPRHLWPELFRLVSECRPATIFGEEVEGATELGDEDKKLSWLDLVYGDLERAGYAAWAAVFPAAAVGAPHLRNRLYVVGDRGRFVADPDGDGHVPEGEDARQGPAGADMERHFWAAAERVQCGDRKRRLRRPGSRLVADGVPGCVALLRGAGNAIVPQQAEAFVRAYLEACGGPDRIARRRDTTAAGELRSAA